VDIALALTHLEIACVELFQESESRPFFGKIFVPLQRLLANTGVMNSVQSIHIDFLVWRISKILVQWALLYTDESKALANATFAAFLEENEAVLTFKPSDVKDDFARADMKFLPRQNHGAKRGGHHAAVHAPALRLSPQKRKATADVPPGPKGAKSQKPAAGGGLPKPLTPPPAKGKYICAGDLLHRVDPVTYLPCKKSSDECNQRHIQIPSALPARDREELITSITRMQGITTARKAQMCATIHAML